MSMFNDIDWTNETLFTSENIELIYAHHSLNKSAQYLRCSVELVDRPFWRGYKVNSLLEWICSFQ